MSNTGMEQLHHIDKRLTNLEIKSSYGEDLLDTLNQTVFRQQEQIDQLTRELRALRAQVVDGANRRGAQDDLPPHY
jgi:SlyX protein